MPPDHVTTSPVQIPCFSFMPPNVKNQILYSTIPFSVWSSNKDGLYPGLKDRRLRDFSSLSCVSREMSVMSRALSLPKAQAKLQEIIWDKRSRAYLSDKNLIKALDEPLSDTNVYGFAVEALKHRQHPIQGINNQLPETLQGLGKLLEGSSKVHFIIKYTDIYILRKFPKGFVVPKQIQVIVDLTGLKTEEGNGLTGEAFKELLKSLNLPINTYGLKLDGYPLKCIDDVSFPEGLKQLSVIKCEIDNRLFEKNIINGLEYLNLSDNNISEVNCQCLPKSLRGLRLNDNPGLNWILNIKYLENLESLYLNSSKFFNGSSCEDFLGMKNLKRLYLATTGLTKTSLRCKDLPDGIEVLDVSGHTGFGCDLKALKGLKKLLFLKIDNVNEVQIALEDLPESLRCLDVSDNKRVEFTGYMNNAGKPEGSNSTRLRSLKSVDMNRVENINIEDTVFLKNVEYLRFSATKGMKQHLEYIEKLKNLKEFDMSRLDASGFKIPSSKRLAILNVSHNPLGPSLKNIELHEGLRELNIEQCGLTYRDFHNLKLPKTLRKINTCQNSWLFQMRVRSLRFLRPDLDIKDSADFI